MNSAVGALEAASMRSLEALWSNRWSTNSTTAASCLAGLIKPITEKSKGPAREMERLLAFCQDSILPEAPTEAVPRYDPAGLLFAAQSADSQFQELWKARLGFIVLALISRVTVCIAELAANVVFL
jgi:hypothetical protein